MKVIIYIYRQIDRQIDGWMDGQIDRQDFKLQLNYPPHQGVQLPGMTVTGTVLAVKNEPKDYEAIQVKIVGLFRPLYFISYSLELQVQFKFQYQNISVNEVFISNDKMDTQQIVMPQSSPLPASIPFVSTMYML